MRDDDTPWGTDGKASLPEALKDADTIRIDMGGFCFTSLGLRIDITEVEREQLIGRSFGPGGQDD